VEQVVGHERSSQERRTSERLFHRDLPGGGYVAIELTPGDTRQVRMIVERRCDRARRVGHRAPVIVQESWRPERGIGDLYRMACDNVAIARALLLLKRVD